MPHPRTVQMVAACLALSACAAPEAPSGERLPASAFPVWPEAARGVANGELARLCADAWEFRMREHPTEATELGDPRYHQSLADISREADERRVAAINAFRARASAISAADLGAEDRVTLAMLDQSWRTGLAEHALGIDVGSWNLNPRGGPQIDLLNLGRDQPVATPRERAQLVKRWRAMPQYLDRACENLRRGLSAGRVTSRHAAEEVVACIERVLAEPTSSSPLVTAADRAPAEYRDGFQAELAAIVETEIHPALARYADVVRREVLPAARDDDHPGVKWIAGGDRYYALCIERHTSLTLDPDEIHAFGAAEIERIRREISELGAKVFAISDVAAIQARLRSDPALHFASAEEIVAVAEATLARAEAAVPAAFGIRPRASCTVVPIPAHEAPFTSIAYYQPPAARAAPDAERNGRYFVNVHEPTTRPRYEAEALGFHEAVPGHHLQIAIAQELDDLPLVRRHGGSTAFVEGWALYTERLADELRLYSSDVDRLGMLSYDAWRAARLVVDTGIHHLGWSRERGIAYLMDNTLLARNNVENEVDRYIAWPGQALAYKLGQREILDLRAEARAALGDRFRLAEFHDRVLESGAITLGALRAKIRDWIARGGG